METKKIKAGREDRIFNITVTVISLVVLVIVLYPLYFVIIASISSPEDISLGKVRFLPSGINFAAYKFVLEEWKIWRGYLNTIFYTFFGTLLGTSVTLMAAFALSRKDLFGRNVITKLFVFTMFFSGGLIPTYMVVSSLHMVNTRTVLVVMGTVTVYNMIIARTFISSIPDDLEEAAMIDGCSHARYFFEMVVPLSKAIIAVLMLYYAVGHWNAYFNALIYLSNRALYPLQLFLREILVLNTAGADTIMDPELEEKMRGMAELLKYALIVVSTAPILCAYPFAQKYFTKGVMVGSLKG